MNELKLLELRTRMIRHKAKGGHAIVELTARELEELLELAEAALNANKPNTTTMRF